MPPPRAQAAIADHGMIGDLRTAALVARDGTIDWFCPARFDAPSVFGAIVDSERGGHWRIAPADEEPRVAQFYFPDSNVLTTRFMTTAGVVEIQDFMPVSEHERLVRRVSCVRGRMRLRSELCARFDYGRAAHRTRRNRDGVVLATDELKLTLFAEVALRTERGDVHAEIDVREGQSATFVLHVDDVADPDCHLGAAATAMFDDTVAYWRDWLAGSSYTGRWREMVNRSALTLKLLTYLPTGAIVAAPTAGLPEELGGERNWDYRYVWMRDAAFTVYALIRLGFTAEAKAFNAWTAERLADDAGGGKAGPLQVMYRIDGDPELREVRLDHLDGHRGSRPVRVGNDAARQLQLDIYGELIDSIYLYDKYGAPISHDTWMQLSGILDWLAEHWDEPDAGIWETRSESRRHTFSRLMCWVAFERMIRVARTRGLPADVVGWSRVRDEIYSQIVEEGYDENRAAFVGRLDDGRLDAALLLMPMVKFCSPAEPRFRSTLAAIESELVADTLVYRYDDAVSDGVAGDEGTFSMCSFWYVEALTRVGRLQDARLALEKMFTYANHLGLYAEQISATGEQRGNFPQAFTHFSLISAAYNLDRALGGGE
ncbi:MAG: glycoside hydrolase family 15 protein [Solirubrobacterales bacterium]|nr:glycoside hydrolase family 15 protein [Solirubrobacterales bacterium]